MLEALYHYHDIGDTSLVERLAGYRVRPGMFTRRKLRAQIVDLEAEIYRRNRRDFRRRLELSSFSGFGMPYARTRGRSRTMDDMFRRYGMLSSNVTGGTRG